ncbi:MAG: hypothetical protein LBO62_07175 [Endomicrobium sp.]|jgi:chromosome segregation ATPase|nr:hypothetical protein [Endomicrobium sp.]
MNKVLSWLIAAFLLLNAYPSFAQEKKDVKDPVLREIISQMKDKMPKFINKHGDSLFVEDELISRASLLSAFYEYDTKIGSSLGKGSFANKQDLDSLSKKVDALAKSSAKAESSAPSAKIDIVALINELDPNMPTLLDKNLKNSKVFKELQKQVGAAGASPSKVPSSMISVEKDLREINARIDALAKNFDSVKRDASSLSSSGADSVYVDKEISNVNKRLDALSKKIDGIKNVPASAQASSSSPAPESVSAAYVDAEIADLNRKIEALSKQLNSSKPVTPVDQALQKDINQSNKKIDELADKINSLSKTASLSAASSSSASSREMEEIKRNLQQIQQSYVNLSRRLDDLSASVAGAAQKEKPEIIFINKQIEDIKKSISEIPNDFQKEIIKTKSETQSDISKTASDLQKEINKTKNETQSGINKTASDIQKEINKTKIETQTEVEKRLTVAQKELKIETQSEVEKARREMIKTRSEAQNDIDRIERRLNNVSRLRERGRADSAAASTIATISLGLTMIAALLAAR